VEKRYVLDGPRGEEALADLFDGRHQLVVYHFMFDPSWDLTFVAFHPSFPPSTVPRSA